MHITLETDYAIRIVDRLARHKLGLVPVTSPEKPRLDAKTIADTTGVPVRFALKILHKLVNASLVSSYKGVRGGYEIAREAGEISLYDVVGAIEGAYRFSRCLDEDYACTCGSHALGCGYQRVFGEISESVCARLKKETFAELILRTKTNAGGNDE